MLTLGNKLQEQTKHSRVKAKLLKKANDKILHSAINFAVLVESISGNLITLMFTKCSH